RPVRVSEAAAPGPAPAPVLEPRRLRGVVRAARASALDPAGAPVAGATVALAGDAAVTTDAAGRFAIPHPAPGMVTLKLTAEGFQPDDEVVSLPAAGDVDVEIELRPAQAAA